MISQAIALSIFAILTFAGCNRRADVTTPHGNETTQQSGRVDAMNNPSSREQTGVNPNPQSYANQNHPDQPGTVGNQTNTGDAQHPFTLNSDQSKSSSQTSRRSSIDNSNQ